MASLNGGRPTRKIDQGLGGDRTKTAGLQLIYGNVRQRWQPLLQLGRNWCTSRLS